MTGPCAAPRIRRRAVFLLLQPGLGERGMIVLILWSAGAEESVPQKKQKIPRKTVSLPGDVVMLFEVPVEQTLERLAMAGLVLRHLVDGVVNSIIA